MVGFAIGSFEFGLGVVGLGRTIVEEAVSHWSADSLVKEDKEQSCAGALISQAMGVAFTIAFD